MQLADQFSVTDLGRPKQFLGMKINFQEDGSICLSQERYIDAGTTPYITGHKHSDNPKNNGKDDELSDRPYSQRAAFSARMQFEAIFLDVPRFSAMVATNSFGCGFACHLHDRLLLEACFFGSQ
jgi:hypothetical protein